MEYRGGRQEKGKTRGINKNRDRETNKRGYKKERKMTHGKRFF